MSGDDIFSRLFELFDQPGPINWKLAAEVARHLSGEPEPIEPWASEEYRELARLAEYRIEESSPFRVSAAIDVLPLDRRGWSERNLEAYAGLIEPFVASIVDGGPAAALMSQMSPAIIGLQAGSLVGSLSTWVVSSFDAGLPQNPIGPMSLIIPNMAGLADAAGTEEAEARLWVVANEVAFRSISQLPWIHDHVHTLTTAYADAVTIDPAKLGGIMGMGSDPSAIQAAIEEAGGVESLFGGDEAEGPRAELEAFLGAVTGCARLIARRALIELTPGFDAVSGARDRIRQDEGAQPPIGVGPVPVEATQLGDVFNQEVERRYGEDALETLWADPSRMPTAAELADPTGWAARVLLEGFEF